MGRRRKSFTFRQGGTLLLLLLSYVSILIQWPDRLIIPLHPSKTSSFWSIFFSILVSVCLAGCPLYVAEPLALVHFFLFFFLPSLYFVVLRRKENRLATESHKEKISSQCCFFPSNVRSNIVYTMTDSFCLDELTERQEKRQASLVWWHYFHMWILRV